MRQKGAAEDWGWGVGERGSLLTEGGSHKGGGGGGRGLIWEFTLTNCTYLSKDLVWGPTRKWWSWTLRPAGRPLHPRLKSHTVAYPKLWGKIYNDEKL